MATHIAKIVLPLTFLLEALTEDVNTTSCGTVESVHARDHSIIRYDLFNGWTTNQWVVV